MSRATLHNGDCLPFPVFVSEYDAPGDFKSIWCKSKMGLFKKTKDSKYHIHVEHVFVHDRFCPTLTQTKKLVQQEFAL